MMKFGIIAVAVLVAGPGLAQSNGSMVVADTAPVRLLPGYENAFKDGRLNPQRGERLPQGRSQMETIWTDEVPMRLKVPASR